jgi:hypothetical protein
MSNLHWDTISPDMRLVMNAFGNSEIGQHFYLAGGTALPLQREVCLPQTLHSDHYSKHETQGCRIRLHTTQDLI